MRLSQLAIILGLLHASLCFSPAAPVFSITGFVTCEDANTNAPNDWHVPQAVFETNADHFFVWVELTNVSGQCPVEMKLYRPAGTYYGKEMQPINETNGPADWWRMTAWWDLKGKDIAQIPGLWKLDLVIDGTLQRSIFLRIGPTNAVASMALAQTTSVRNSRTCVIFASSDLVHWTAIQTNAVPDTITATEEFRLKLHGPGNRNCFIEVSPDSTNWSIIQTNDLRSGADNATACFYRAEIR